MEIWKTIKNYNNYEVSNLGRVRNKEPQIKFEDNYNKKIISKIKKQRISTSGYKCVDLYNNYGKETKMVHRLVGKAFLKQNGKNFINHKDGNKLNNKLSNLEWVTPKENSIHAKENGLITCRGEKHHKAKLNKNEVLQIKYMIKNSYFNQTEIADMFKLSIAQVSRIKTGKRWAHLKNS